MGPTGIGKTDLAFKLYDSANVEIISVDSVQVYKHLNIGSGKPDKKFLNKYPHKLIDVIDPHEKYSTGKFQKDCLKEIKKANSLRKCLYWLEEQCCISRIYFMVYPNYLNLLKRLERKWSWNVIRKA